MGQAAVPGHAPATPTRPALGRLHHFVEHGLHLVRGQSRGPSGPGRFLQSGQARVQNTLTPLAHRHMAGVELGGDLVVVHALGGQQSNAGAADDLLRRAGSLNQTSKLGPLFGR